MGFRGFGEFHYLSKRLCKNIYQINLTKQTQNMANKPAKRKALVLIILAQLKDRQFSSSRERL
jgi:hypothetical protein